MKEKADKGFIGAILFGLAFASVGIGLLVFSVIPTLYDWVRMKSWHPAKARLLAAEMDMDHSSERTIYKPSASFRYKFEGKFYTSDRIAIGTSSDNVGSFQEDLGNELRRAYRYGRIIQVWVNPDAPGEAIFNRDLRWGLLGFKMTFVILFGGFGLAVLYYSNKEDEDKDKDWEVPEFKEQPWLAEAKWRGGEIKSEARNDSIGTWIIAVMWNLISTPIIFMIPGELENGNYGALIGLVLPLAGISLLVSAVKQTLRWRRFGASPFKMRPFPGRLGDRVAGSIDINLPFKQDREFNVALACLRCFSGSSEHDNRQDRVIWQDKQGVRATSGVSGTRVYIEFSIPNDLPASEQESDSYHKWVLYVDTKLDGPDYKRQFELPVFPGVEERAAGLSRDAVSKLSTSSSKSLSHKDITNVEGLLGMAKENGNLHWHYPVWRSPVSSIALFVLGVACLVIAWFAGTELIREVSFASMFDTIFDLFLNFVGLAMAGVFSLAGLLLLILGVYLAANSLTLVMESDRILSQRRLFGVSADKKSILFSNIKDITKKITSSSSTAGSHRVNYEIFAVTRDGKKHTLAEGLSSASDAEFVVDYFFEKIS